MAPAAATNKCYYALLGYPINSAPGSFRAEVTDPLVWYSQNCNSGNPQHSSPRSTPAVPKATFVSHTNLPA